MTVVIVTVWNGKFSFFLFRSSSRKNMSVWITVEQDSKFRLWFLIKLYRNIISFQNEKHCRNQCVPVRAGSKQSLCKIGNVLVQSICCSSFSFWVLFLPTFKYALFMHCVVVIIIAVLNYNNPIHIAPCIVSFLIVTHVSWSKLEQLFIPY